MRRAAALCATAVAMGALIIAASWSVWEAAVRARDAEVARIGGERLVTFRTRQGAEGVPGWTPQDLEALRSIDGVARVEWGGGYVRSQRAGSPYVIPSRDTSPGYLSLLRTPAAAGRILGPEDADRSRVVISEATALQLFRGVPLAEVVGRLVYIDGRWHEVVGVTAGSMAAYRAVRAPPLRYGDYDVMDVYVEVPAAANLPAVLEALDAFLSSRPRLAMLEAASYREFVDPEPALQREPYVRELVLVQRALLVLLLLGVAHLTASLALASVVARQGELALHRTVGASRRALVRAEGLRALAPIAMGAALGAGCGLVLGGWLGGHVSASGWVIGTAAGLLGAAAGLVAGVTLPLARAPLNPLRHGVLRLRHPVVRASMYGGIALAMGALVIGGGMAVGGLEAVGRDLHGIGADLIELGSGASGTILPRALPVPEDQAALERAVPDLAPTYVARRQGYFSAGERQAEGIVVAARGPIDRIVANPLERGCWSALRQPGAVLGRTLARSLLGDDGVRGLGSCGAAAPAPEITIDIQGRRVTLPVVGIAGPPRTELLEAVTVPDEGVLMPVEALSLPTWGTASLYVVAGPRSREKVERAIEILNARYPTHAPFVMEEVARSYRSRWERLWDEVDRLGVLVGAVALLFLASEAALLYVESLGRRTVWAIKRAVGATSAALLREAVLARGDVALASLAGAAGGITVLTAWARQVGYGSLVPFGWIAAGVAAMGVITCLLGWAAQRWESGSSPAQLLRTER